MKKQKFQIGQKIRFSKAYQIKCSDRFSFNYDLEDIREFKAGRPSEPQAFTLNGEAYVIGLRRAIMGEYKFYPEKKHFGFDEPIEYEQASASGKFEECLVCVRQLKPFKPFLVRKKDVINEPTEPTACNPPSSESLP